jgi:hypothetical protein
MREIDDKEGIMRKKMMVSMDYTGTCDEFNDFQ